ncbi:MAG: hypothetical protein ACOC6G_02455 [Thermoproteota archaeon]
MANAVKDLGDTLTDLVDKLGGKGSDIKLSFQDLTLEIAGLKAKVNGSLILDILYVSEKK